SCRKKYKNGLNPCEIKSTETSCMKVLLTTLLIAAMPALALAQSTEPAIPATKTAAKPAPKKGKLKPSAQKAIEEATPVDDDPAVTLTPADLEVAKRVLIGDIPCELGA